MIPQIKILLKSKDLLFLMAKYIIAVAVIMALVFALSFFTSCQMAPKRDCYICEECYVATDCLYRMKSADNATVCAQLVEACRDAMKESRYTKRMEYCRDNKFKGLTERECLLMLNQK